LASSHIARQDGLLHRFSLNCRRPIQKLNCPDGPATIHPVFLRRCDNYVAPDATRNILSGQSETTGLSKSGRHPRYKRVLAYRAHSTGYSGNLRAVAGMGCQQLSVAKTHRISFRRHCAGIFYSRARFFPGPVRRQSLAGLVGDTCSTGHCLYLSTSPAVLNFLNQIWFKSKLCHLLACVNLGKPFGPPEPQLFICKVGIIALRVK